MMQKVLYVGFIVALSVSTGAFTEGFVGLGVGALTGALGLLAPLVAGEAAAPVVKPKR